VRNQIMFNLFTDFENFFQFKPTEQPAGTLAVMLDQLVPWTRGFAAIRREPARRQLRPSRNGPAAPAAGGPVSPSGSACGQDPPGGHRERLQHRRCRRADQHPAPTVTERDCQTGS
jgi:hypothetical protein